jgi:hypothetical protein
MKQTKIWHDFKQLMEYKKEKPFDFDTRNIFFKRPKNVTP